MEVSRFEDESVTYVNRKNENYSSSKKSIYETIEESTGEQLFTETFVDDDSINEESLENKKEYIENNNEYILLPESVSDSKNKTKCILNNRAEKKLNREISKDKINDKRNSEQKSVIEFILAYIMSIILYIIGILKLSGERSIKLITNEKDKQYNEISDNKIVDQENNQNFQLSQSRKQKFRSNNSKKQNFQSSKGNKSNFRLIKNNKPNFRLRKVKNRPRLLIQEKNRDVYFPKRENVNIRKMAMISFIRMILNPILIFLIGKALVSLPDVSNTIELVFEQFNISEESIPMVLLLLNGIIILIFSGIIGSINYYKSYLERTYGSNTEIIGKKYIDRVCNLGRISMNNFILYAIGVFGTLLNSNGNISQVSQLSLLYTLLLIPYSILVMVDYHHYLPLPQGALLYIYLYGCLSSKINSKNLYQEILSLPETIKSIRQNSIHL